MDSFLPTICTSTVLLNQGRTWFGDLWSVFSSSAGPWQGCWKVLPRHGVDLVKSCCRWPCTDNCPCTCALSAIIQCPSTCYVDLVNGVAAHNTGVTCVAAITVLMKAERNAPLWPIPRHRTLLSVSSCHAYYSEFLAWSSCRQMSFS